MGRPKPNFTPRGKSNQARQQSAQRRQSTGGSIQSAFSDLFKPAKRVTKKTHGDGLKSDRNPKRSGR